MNRLSLRAAVIAAGLGLSATVGQFARAAEPCQKQTDPTEIPVAEAFRTTSRWSSTAASGSGLQQGQPTTIRWSIVPDGTAIPASGNGESAGPSVLISKFDTLWGINTAAAGTSAAALAQRPWYALFSQSFTRWSQLAAVTYEYVSDDGVAMGGSNSSGGPTRGDVRIASFNIDGAGTILAYNYYPSTNIGGDMVLDASDITSSRIGSSGNNYRYGRNTIMHEAGHGLGIMHFLSNNSAGLMEPSISTGFDGPQFDDILSAQRLYGDVLERNGGNDTAAQATSLGVMVHGNTRSRGIHADDAVVAANETDFISIDDESDKDYFSFTLAHYSKLAITLTPKGPTYNEAPQTTPASTQVALNTAAFSDLLLTLYNTNGTSILMQLNETGLGGVEAFAGLDLAPGTYFAAITGQTLNAIQMYRIDVAVSIPEPASIATASMGLVLLLRRRRALD